ncbi:MAG: DUF4417 domain-containing protein [Anaerolineaceae bacterium]|nr:DUF4417 domain-containing protein [Anaerolineaceae bacterium]
MNNSSYKSERKVNLDDGCNPELLEGAKFVGKLEFPLIERPRYIHIPKQIVPFSKREYDSDFNITIGFHENDVEFADVILHPFHYINDFCRFDAILSPDCSLYRDNSLTGQCTNAYRSRVIGSFYQRKGIYVIPQIRWGDERTYTTMVYPEKIAFLGVEKKGIVAIGSYGMVKERINRYYFSAGLEAMLSELEPQVVIVYGPDTDSIFEQYSSLTKFVFYPDWTTQKHGRENNGKRN